MTSSWFPANTAGISSVPVGEGLTAHKVAFPLETEYVHVYPFVTTVSAYKIHVTIAVQHSTISFFIAAAPFFCERNVGGK